MSKRLPESPCIALADTLERRKRRDAVSAERFLLSRRKHLAHPLTVKWV